VAVSYRLPLPIPSLQEKRRRFCENRQNGAKLTGFWAILAVNRRSFARKSPKRWQIDRVLAIWASLRLFGDRFSLKRSDFPGDLAILLTASPGISGKSPKRSSLPGDLAILLTASPGISGKSPKLSSLPGFLAILPVNRRSFARKSPNTHAN